MWDIDEIVKLSRVDFPRLALGKPDYWRLIARKAHSFEHNVKLDYLKMNY